MKKYETVDDTDGIPSFLRMTQEERRKAWERNPPKAMPILKAVPTYRTPEDEAEIEAWKIEKAARDKAAAEARAKSRAALAKQRKDYMPGSTWDINRSVWVHPVIEQKKKEETGEAFKLVILNKSPRAPGSRAATRFNEMVAFLEKNPRASMAEVYAATSYTKTDFDWDLQRGSVKKNYTKE